MTAAAPIDRDKMVKLLGLLGSDFAGERAAAGLKATQALKAAGMTWSELLQPAVAHTIPPPPPPGQSFGARAGVQFCLKHCEHVSPWERTFIGSVVRRSSLSAKQVSIVRQIADSLRARGFA